MKVAPILIGAMVAAALLVSCSDDGTEAHIHDAGKEESQSVSVSTVEGLEGLGLNNGQKWEVDDHTRSMFAKMTASFMDADHQALEGDGLRDVGAALQADINELIQGCTMTGPAHDQLHVFLMAYMPAVASLSESGHLEGAKKIGLYLEQYDEHFK